MRAQLQWVSSKEGGRAQLPTGNRYVTIARIADSRSRRSGEIVGDWSMVVASLPSPHEQGFTTLCDVSFLAPNAPNSELVSGVSFQLLEGARIVAHGVIL
jgi:hypothetical protein